MECLQRFYIFCQSVTNFFCKLKNSLAPKIVKDVFKLNDIPYNTRNNSDFQHRNVKTVLYGSGTLSSLSPQICDLIPVPPDIRNLASLYVFKNKIKSCSTRACPCRLSKKFINICFVNYQRYANMFFISF